MKSSIFMLAASAALPGHAAPNAPAKRNSDSISSCGNQTMARDDVQTNHGTITRRGYLSAVSGFCQQANGKSVPAGGNLSMATRVFLSEGDDPTSWGLNGYVYFEVHNQQGSGEHLINASDCNDYFKQLSNENSTCRDDRRFNDTKGGTWEVGQNTVSYSAMGQLVLPAQDAVDKLYGKEALKPRTGQDGTALDPFPTDFTKDVTPILCHSHNDYVQQVPLFYALSAGCVSVEGDVYVYGSNLRVAHDDPGDTGPTLQQLYLDPIKAILDAQQSIFPMNKDQDLTLLVDFKASPNETWAALMEALQPLNDAGYLSHWNGSNFIRSKVTVVASGAAELDEATNDTTNPNRTIFIDAPLGQTLNDYNVSNSYYASASYLSDIKFFNATIIDSDDLKRLEDQIGQAHKQKLLVRYYTIPSDDMWQQMYDIGVDRINVDFFEALAGIDWKRQSETNQTGAPSATGTGPASTTHPSQASSVHMMHCPNLLVLSIAVIYLLV